MGQIRSAPLLLPGSYGLNSRDVIAADQVLRFGATVSNGVVDSSGKLVSRQDFVNQTSAFTGIVEQMFTHRLTAGTEVILSAALGKVYSGTSTLTSRADFTKGYQVVDVGGAKAGASATGLANDATVYNATATIDGVAKVIAVTGSAAQTYTTLLAEINTDIGVAGTAAIVAGNLRITSATTGASSTVAITDGAAPNLFSTLTNYVAIRTANAGTVATAGTQVVNVGGAKVGGDPTGLANDSTAYTATIVVDGVTKNISVVGSAAQTYTTLLSEINTDLGSSATASLSGGNILVTSATSSYTSSIAITAGTLFTGSLPTGFVGINAATAGTSAKNDWQFASLNSRIYMAQAGRPLTCLLETSYDEEALVAQPWTSSPNVVMSAYGRLWAADDAAGSNRYTIWWSDLLNGKAWTGGDAGSISLQNAWPAGQDSIVALAAAFGRLIVFGRSCILLYTLGTDNDPGNMTLTSVISNIGCVARDSVVVTDDGVYFLADNGLYRVDPLANVTSLMMLPQMSVLYNADILATYASETLARVRAGYYPKEGWYVINSPITNKCYVLNLRQKVPQVNVPVVTTWTNVGMPFRAFCYDKDGNWYCAGTNGVYKYTGYTSDGANSTYTFDYYTQWLNFGDESRLKHLKYVVLTFEAISGQTGTFRWRTEYKDGTTYTASFTCSAVEFAENPGIGETKAHVGRSANVAKFGFTMPVTAKITLHQLKLFSQVGKTTFR